MTEAADPISAVFPADRIESRFVVAMSIARNDLELALRDAIDAAREDRQDFTYRVRLVTSHLVEALVSLEAYNQASADVQKLIAAVPGEHRTKLAKARKARRDVGAQALEHVRHNTFHVPATDPKRAPMDSDAQLRDVLAALSARPASVHMDHRSDHPVAMLTFASDVALAMAFGRHSTDLGIVREQFTAASEGAVAFAKWAEALLITYLRKTGGGLGTPQLIE